MIQRILCSLALILGALGTIGCVAVMIAIWMISARVTQATEKVFGVADTALHGASERVAKIGDRVQTLKLTTTEIQDGAKTWVKSEASEIARSRLNVQQKAETLLTELDRAEQLLQLTESSVDLIQQAMTAGQSLGISLDTDSVKELLADLTTIQTKLHEGIDVAQNISQRAAEASDEKLLADRAEQIAKLVARVIATLGIVDQRIAAIEDRLAKIDAAVDVEKQKVIGWMNLATIGITLLFAWLGAGQSALCYLGFRGLRPSSA